MRFYVSTCRSMLLRIDLGITSGEDLGEETPAKSARVQELIRARNFEELLKSDQLKSAQAAGAVFAGFNEAPITFPPTFKVSRDVGFQYKDQRISSYCDRILWKSHPLLANDVRCLSYEAHGSIASSDHKPVSASFEIDCPPAFKADAVGKEPARSPILQFISLAGSDLLVRYLVCKCSISQFVFHSHCSHYCLSQLCFLRSPWT